MKFLEELRKNSPAENSDRVTPEHENPCLSKKYN